MKKWYNVLFDMAMSVRYFESSLFLAKWKNDKPETTLLVSCSEDRFNHTFGYLFK